VALSFAFFAQVVAALLSAHPAVLTLGLSTIPALAAGFYQGVVPTCQRDTGERRCGRQTGSGIGGLRRPKKRTALVADVKDQEFLSWPFSYTIFIHYHNDPKHTLS